MCFPHVNNTNIKIESLFFGGSETSTLLEWGRWTEAGDKEGARGGGLEQQCCQKKTHEGKLMCLLGVPIFDSSKEAPPKRANPKQFQHLGLTLVTLVTCFVPVKLEGKK